MKLYYWKWKYHAGAESWHIIHHPSGLQKFRERRHPPTSASGVCSLSGCATSGKHWARRHRPPLVLNAAGSAPSPSAYLLPLWNCTNTSCGCLERQNSAWLKHFSSIPHRANNLRYDITSDKIGRKIMYILWCIVARHQVHLTIIFSSLGVFDISMHFWSQQMTLFER